MRFGIIARYQLDNIKIGIPFTSSTATDAVEENRMGMDSHEHFINIGDDNLYEQKIYP